MNVLVITVNANELGIYALPKSCRFRMCIICWVDLKGAKFIGNKHANKFTHSLTHLETLIFSISTDLLLSPLVEQAAREAATICPAPAS